MTQHLNEWLQCCTVKITISGSGGWGTGFFVAPGLILTCAHVVKAASANSVTVFYPGQNQSYLAIFESLPEANEQADLVLLKLQDAIPSHPCVYLDAVIALNDRLYSYGYPDDFSEGAFTTFESEALTGGNSFIKFKAGQVRPGMSGSPLLNQSTGKVCGIVKFTRDRSIDLGGGAIPTRVIMEQFPQLRQLQQEFHQRDRRWSRLLKQPSEIDFQPYLESIAKTYEKWWQYYTLTDAESQQQQAQESAPIFDFGLMVQTVLKQEPEQPLQEKQEKEQIERFSVLEGLRKYALRKKPEHMLLVGRPGSGKSTALARLMLEEATKPNARIPVLVELRYWQGSIAQLILNALKRHDPLITTEQLESVLTQSLILFDGVNELPSEEARTQLSAFRRDQLKVPMIFTTRDLSLGGDLGIERKLEMQPLTEPQMQAFIRAYIPEQAEAMLRQLNNRLWEFGQTPLLLWMLCEVFQQAPGNQLPSNLGGVFQAFSKMYEESSVRKHEVALLKGDVRPLSDRRLWKGALTAIASIMMQGETPVDFRVAIHRYEAERELRKVFTHEKFPVRDILDDLLKYHLLQNRSVDQIEFRHQLIQEYYAAEYLLQNLQTLSDEQLKRDYLNYLKWTEPLALMLALEEEAQALRVVRLAIDDVDLILGARLAGAVKYYLQPRTINLLLQLPLLPKLQIDCLAETVSDAAIPALLQFLEDQVLETRLSAIYALGKLGSNGATPGLLKALRDESLDIRDAASDALSGLDPSISIPLSLQLLEDEDPSLREIASQVLGELNHLEAQPKILEKLEDQDLDVRASAAIALGIMGCKASIPHLLELLDPPYSYLTWRAAELLGELGVESAIPSLIKALIDQDSYVRTRAVESLGKYGSEAAVLGLLDALEDQEISVQIAASGSLVKLSKKVSIPVLLKVLEEGNPNNRKNAIDALEKIGDEIAIPALIKALEDEEQTVQIRAANTLGKIKSSSAVPNLIQLLKHQNPLILSVAAHALGMIGSQSATPDLIQAFSGQSQNSFAWISIVIALGRLGHEVATLLLLLLADLELPPFLRANIVEVLGEIREKITEPQSLLYLTKAVIPRLLIALKNESSHVRRQAAVALGKLGNSDTVPELIQALADDDKYVCQSIADSLGRIGSKAAIFGLLKLLEDEDWAVRSSAINSLEKLGGEEVKKTCGEEAIQVFLKTLENKNWYIRRDAIDLLGKLGYETFIPKLLKILNNENILGDGAWEICCSAIDALVQIGIPKHLAILWGIYLQNPEVYFPRAIYSIQNRYKYYNYEIFQTAIQNQKQAFLAGQPTPLPTDLLVKIDQTTQQIDRRAQQMVNTPKYDFNNADFKGAAINFGDNPAGNFIGTQNNYATDPEVQGAIADLQILLTQLQSQHPQIRTETEALTILDAEFTEIKQSRTHRLTTLRKQLLNPERHLQATKAALGEVAKHYLEESVWAKALLTYLDKLSEELNQEV